MDQNETNSSKRRNWLIIGGFFIVAILIIAGLFLPPVSLGQRLGMSSLETEQLPADTAADLEMPTADSVMPEGVVISMSQGSVNVSSVPQSEYLAGTSALPEQLTPIGDVYTFSSEDAAPQGQVALPIPADAGSLTTLDLYGWDNQQWFFVPSQVDANSAQIVSAEIALPAALAMMQVNPPDQTAAGVETSGEGSLPASILPLITEVSVGGISLGTNGAVNGEATPLPQGAYDQWLRTTNVGPIIDQSALSSLLSDQSFQTEHINNLVNLAAAGGFAGINLDYQEVPPNQAESFSAFAAALAESLHGQGLDLAITLGTPAVNGSDWDTGGQDWAALGTIADVVYVQLPLNPTEYDAGDGAVQLMSWATRHIDRTKLSALVDSRAVDRIGESYVSLTNEKALSNFGELQFVQGSEEVTPNETVEVALSGTANPLEWDGEGLTYKYSYEKDSEIHEVWLSSEASLSHRLQKAIDYNLRGVAVRGLENVENGNGYATVFNNIQGAGEAPQPTGAAIVWTVQNGNDSILASESGNELAFSWNVGESEGEYTVNADFALGDNIARLDSLVVSVKAAPEEEVVEEVITAEETPAATAASTTTFTGSGDAVVNVGANVRTGPGLTYGTLSDGATPGMEVDLIGRNSDSTWLNIVMPDGREGWIFATLLTVSPSVVISDLEVIEVAAPAAIAANVGNTSGEDGETPPASAAAPPPPVAAAPVSNPGFELGGQSHSFGNPQLMSYAGMNWVKFQHKWGPGDDPSAVAGRIQQAHANGFKVLLSIPGSETYPSSIDFNGYVAFLGGVAALGPDAIEVWNEENIDFEWPAGTINPASYVNNMLAPAYNAIKGANSSVMVISGAPAPTGYFGGGCSSNGCDDNAYLAGMAAAGAANYMDCVGVHFNAGATPPSQSSGHPAGGSHYSWYFQPTMDLYYSSLGKPVCFTELGYLSGEDFGGVPGRFSWAGNTSVSEHAQWLAEAVSMAANSGKARLAIIFNVDFTQWGDDPQAGYAMIRPDGGCPACETLRQVMGR